MLMAYIAGPYTARTREGVYENIARARAVALKYWWLGYAVICPHTNTGGYESEFSEECLMRGDLEFLKRCDLIVMMKGWQTSVGATAELEFARQHNIFVIFE